MEPLSLATLVVSALTSLATGLASGAAERVLSGVDRLSQVIRDHLADDSDTLGLVDEVSTAPTEVAEERLTLRLAQRIMKDPHFAEALQEALEAGGPGSVIEAQDVGVVAARDVRLSGRYVAGRDLTLGRPDGDEG
jgi:hypothetical protein